MATLQGNGIWSAVAPVDINHSSIAYEGEHSALITTLNAGPGVITIEFWSCSRPTPNDQRSMQRLFPGKTTVISANLVRYRVIEEPGYIYNYAAVAWRIGE
jgi:hypothetical protein